MKRIVTLVIIIAFVISGTVVFADTQAGNSSEGDAKDAFAYASVSYSYKNDGKYVSSEFLYNDGMLLADAENLSGDIAKISVALACSAYDPDCIYKALGGMGFSVFEKENYTSKATLEDNDFVAYTVAGKTLTYNGEEYLALCVPGTDDRKLRNLCHCMAAGDKEVFLVHSVCQQECVPVVVADLGSGDLS